MILVLAAQAVYGVDAGAPSADREAILSMAGAFRIEFQFNETIALSPGYELASPYSSQALGLVEVIADEGDFISLQHVLVVERAGGPPRVVKHWRQDWRYEDTDVLAYRGHSTWERESRPEEAVRGTWTQAVFQTTDAPRYEAVGRWVHHETGSSWESEITWRPLPRRESARTDYDVIQCRNRHTVTHDGWFHEQDNQKLRIRSSSAPSKVIAHEFGLNRYTRVDLSEVEPARAYWAEHAAAWAEVREAWAGILDRPRLTLRAESDGERLDTVVKAAATDTDHRRRLAERLLEFVAQ